MSTRTGPKRDITKRFSTRRDAERYRDRFEHGRRRRTHEREVAAVQKVLQRCGDLSSVVDVGGGTGRFADLFCTKARCVVQLDLAIHMLEVSRSAGIPNGACAYVQADVRRLPIADRGAEMIFCHRLLNHLTVEADRRRALQQLARACGRYLVVSTLGPPRAVQYLRDTYDRWRGAAAAGASRYVTPAALIGELRETGMRLHDRIAIRSFPVLAEFLIFSRD